MLAWLGLWLVAVLGAGSPTFFLEAGGHNNGVCDRQRPCGAIDHILKVAWPPLRLLFFASVLTWFCTGGGQGHPRHRVHFVLRHVY